MDNEMNWDTADVKPCPHGYVFIDQCEECKIIKKCEKHGYLTLSQMKVWPYKNKIYKRCKQCIHEKNQRYQKSMQSDPIFLENKKQKNKEYWIKNKEILKEKRKNCSKKYKVDKELENKRCKDIQKIYRKDLHESYVKRILVENHSLLEGNIPKELVETKTAIIRLNRKIKEIKNENR